VPINGTLVSLAAKKRPGKAFFISPTNHKGRPIIRTKHYTMSALSHQQPDMKLKSWVSISDRIPALRSLNYGLL
jgi:hypothetical protein